MGQCQHQQNISVLVTKASSSMPLQLQFCRKCSSFKKTKTLGIYGLACLFGQPQLTLVTCNTSRMILNIYPGDLLHSLLKKSVLIYTETRKLLNNFGGCGTFLLSAAFSQRFILRLHTKQQAMYQFLRLITNKTEQAVLFEERMHLFLKSCLRPPFSKVRL